MISLTARWHNHFLRDFYFLRDFLVKIRLFPDARRRFAVSEPISIILKVLKRWVSGIYFFFIRFCVVSLMTRSHVHFLRESDFLRDFLDGHNCWDCTTRDASMQELCYVRGRYHPCLLEEIVWSDLTAVWTWFPAPFSSPFFERVSQKIRETKIGAREGINDR